MEQQGGAIVFPQPVETDSEALMNALSSFLTSESLSAKEDALKQQPIHQAAEVLADHLEQTAAKA